MWMRSRNWRKIEVKRNLAKMFFLYVILKSKLYPLSLCKQEYNNIKLEMDLSIPN